jgi:hypothetical protein
MLRPSGLIVAIAVLTASTTRAIRPREVTAVGGSGTDEVQAVVQLALTLDAVGDRHADTLYTAVRSWWATPAFVRQRRALRASRSAPAE